MSHQQSRIPRITTLEGALGENVRLGYLEVWGVDEKGEPLYKVTPEGERRARELLGETEDDS